MLRVHINLSVEDLEVAVTFYSGLLAIVPTERHNDYAKWIIDEPPLHIALSARGEPLGITHVGVQTDASEDVERMAVAAERYGVSVERQHQVHCGYAHSTKAWFRDPAGLCWEVFHSFASSSDFGSHGAD